MDFVTRQGFEVEHLVVDGDEASASGDQMAAADDSLWGSGCGAVESSRCGCSPVHQQRVAVLPRQTDPADVEPRAVLQVKAAKAQRQVADRERPQSPLEQTRQGVAFGSGLRRAASRRETNLLEALLQAGPVGIEPLVEHRHVRLLARELAGRVAPRITEVGDVNHDRPRVAPLRRRGALDHNPWDVEWYGAPSPTNGQRRVWHVLARSEGRAACPDKLIATLPRSAEIDMGKWDQVPGDRPRPDQMVDAGLGEVRARLRIRRFPCRLANPRR